MTASVLTDALFEQEVLKSEMPVLVDFYTDWCRPCKVMAPLLDEVAAELQGTVKVTKIEVDQNRATGLAYAIRSVPTLILFKSGEPLARAGVFTQKSQLLDWITSSLSSEGMQAVQEAAEG